MKTSRNNVISFVAGLALFFILATTAEANTVHFTQSNISVAPGDSLQVDLVGTGFSTGPDGAAFSLTWNPSVLGYVNTSVANPPWDTASVSDSNAGSGIIDYVFLIKSVGNAGSDFAIASFTFDVIGNPGAATTLGLSKDPLNIGFVAPGGAPIDVEYVNSQAQVVPLPAAAWLFGSGILGLLSLLRVRKTSDRLL